MQLLNEYQMIQLTNKIISQRGLGPEFRVIKVQSTDFGLIAYWQPTSKEKNIGASPFIVHKNGTIKEWNEFCHLNSLNPKDVNTVLSVFKKFAENRSRI
jgi:hypothetical protein